MATVKLIARNYSVTNATITNETNMFTDISSDTYGTFHTGSSAAGWITLYDFDFSLVPDGVNIVSVKYKIKILTKTPVCSVNLQKRSSSSTDLCDAITVPNDNEAHIIELTPSVDFNTIKNYSNFAGRHPFAFKISCDANSASHQIYGAEISVTYNAGVNEIIFGDEPLIDLTSDTATASDVLSGKTFHLANGLKATGTLVASPSVATATTGSSTMRTVKFTGLIKEPSWFMLICANTDTTARSARVQHMLYDGTTTTTYYGRSSTAGSIAKSTIYGSFVYNSGIMEISVTTAPYFGAADWVLHYL